MGNFVHETEIIISSSNENRAEPHSRRKRGGRRNRLLTGRCRMQGRRRKLFSIPKSFPSPYKQHSQANTIFSCVLHWGGGSISWPSIAVPASEANSSQKPTNIHHFIQQMISTKQTPSHRLPLQTTFGCVLKSMVVRSQDFFSNDIRRKGISSTSFLQREGNAQSPMFSKKTLRFHWCGSLDVSELLVSIIPPSWLCLSSQPENGSPAEPPGRGGSVG